MKILALLLISFLAPLAPAQTRSVPVLSIADTINPGTGDYLVSNIAEADKEQAPFILIKLDTPGGLLQTTRQIVQQMLNAKIPVVVYVSPQGAHAGSAGALITLAADIAVMAPGANIGAAHPVSAAGQSVDKTMSDKIANDVAAFAESLAKAKGRNTQWAVKAVKNSESITSDEALRTGVIDFIASDTEELLQKLAGWKLKAPKGDIQNIAPGNFSLTPIEMSVKQKSVSFFANPNLAYLLMTIGGIAIWVELTHPGLIFPGVFGAACLLISLVSFQTLPIHYGALGLILLGMGMLIAEMFLPTYGMLGLGGLICFIVGSLFLMDTHVPEFQISLGLILPVAAALTGMALLIGWVVMRSQRQKTFLGFEGLIGDTGEVRENVGATPGKVFVFGELWNAVSADGNELPAGTRVVVTKVVGMTLVVSRKSEGVVS